MINDKSTKNSNGFVQKNLKANFIFNTIDGAAYSFGMVFITFNTIFPVFLRQLGASNFIISFIPFITILGSSLPQLFAAHYVSGLNRKKTYVMFLGFLQRIPWLIIGLGCVFFGSSSPKLLILITISMYVLFALASGFVGPAWFDLFSKVTPIHFRGRLLSIRAIIGQLFGIPGAIITATIIKNVSFPYNYGILFLIAFFLVLISIIALCFLREPIDEIKVVKSDFNEFLRKVPSVLKEKKDFRYYIISRAFFELSLSAAAFYSVYAVKNFGLSDSYAGIFTTITSVSYVSINFVLGFIGDKKGHKVNLLIGQGTSILAAFIAIISNNILLFGFIFVLVAISQSTKDLSINSITVEFCKPEERVTYIALSSIIMIPVSLIVLGMGSIADIFGYSYLFGLTIISSLISIFILYFKVKDPRKAKKAFN